MLGAVCRVRDAFASGLNRRIPKYRLKRLSIGPGRWVDRLAVVVRVKDHRALGFRRNQLAENYRPAPADGKQVRFDSARLEHFDQVRRVLLNIRRIAGHVRNRQEFHQLTDDAVFIGQAVFAHFLRDLRRRRGS